MALYINKSTYHISIQQFTVLMHYILIYIIHLSIPILLSSINEILVIYNNYNTYYNKLFYTLHIHFKCSVEATVIQFFIILN